MKLFGYEENNVFKIYRIFGIKISLRKKKNIIELEQEISMLRNIMDCCIDITKIPPAKGKIRDIQIECTKLLLHLKKICEQNNLTYWLDCGTLIGAIRHKGFVPWDDDIDVCMLREDYNKILPILKKEFENSDFYIREKAPSDNNFQIRITNKENHKIGLDIFPVDKYHKSNLSDEEKDILTTKIKKAQKVFAKTCKNKVFTEEQIQKSKQDLLKIQSEIVTDNKESKCENPALFFGIDYSHCYNQLVFDYDTIFPVQNIEFEGEFFSCPNDFDKYLKPLYGNYMELPNKVSYE